MNVEMLGQPCDLCSGPHDPVLHKKLHRREYMRTYQRINKNPSYLRGTYKKVSKNAYENISQEVIDDFLEEVR